MIDVAVVGGGPVGLAAAIEARLAGLSVVICEPRRPPVDKACGEGLMPGAVRALERLGVRPDGVPFVGIRYLDGRWSAEHRFSAGLGLGARRTALHEALAARAAELGVSVFPVRAAQVSQDSWGVTVAPGIGARWLLACDGLHSTVRREVGLARTPSAAQSLPAALLGRRYGLRRHYMVTPWSDFVEVHWTRSAEVYVTPVGDRLVGVAVLGGPGLDYDTVLDEVGLSGRLSAAQAASTLRGAGPFRQRAVRRTAGRVLLVGDAAGYVDALTGEGLRIGFAQARAAVAAVVAGEPEHYEHSWRRITRDYRALTTMLVAAGRRRRVRRRIVPLAQRLPGLYGAIVDRLAG